MSKDIFKGKGKKKKHKSESMCRNKSTWNDKYMG